MCLEIGLVRSPTTTRNRLKIGTDVPHALATKANGPRQFGFTFYWVHFESRPQKVITFYFWVPGQVRNGWFAVGFVLTTKKGTLQKVLTPTKKGTLQKPDTTYSPRRSRGQVAAKD